MGCMKSKSVDVLDWIPPYYDYDDIEKAIEENNFNRFDQLFSWNKDEYYYYHQLPINYDCNLFDKAYENKNYKIIKMMLDSDDDDHDHDTGIKLPNFFLDIDLLEEDQQLLDIVLDKMNQNYYICKNTFSFLLIFYNWEERTKVVDYILFHSTNTHPIINILIKKQNSHLLEYILIHNKKVTGFDLCVWDNYIEGVKLFIKYNPEKLDASDFESALSDARERNYDELVKLLKKELKIYKTNSK